LAAEAFAFQSKNHPVPSPTAWFVPNGGDVVFLVGPVPVVAVPPALGLAVALPEAAAVETRAWIATVNNIAGLAMAGTWKNAVLAAATEVDSASPDANW